MLSAAATTFTWSRQERGARPWTASSSSTIPLASTSARRRGRSGCESASRAPRAPERARPPARIELCGRMRVELGGRRVEPPGRQGRMILAYLAANRDRPVSRDALMAAVWPETAPADPGAALSTLLARLRSALGADALEGRHELSLRLPEGATVDLELVEAGAARAERALAAGDARAALAAAREALALSEGPFLPEFDEPWVEQRRRDLHELRLGALETCARAGLVLGAGELRAAERSARTLVALAPYSESSHALLMEVQAARGDVAEALLSYDRLRSLLRDELGAAPSGALVALNERLLRSGRPARSAALAAA